MNAEKIISNLQALKKEDKEMSEDVDGDSGRNIDDAYSLGIDLGQVWGFNEAINIAIEIVKNECLEEKK